MSFTFDVTSAGT